MPDNKPLRFDVSTGLKTVIGSDLITDDEVAIFELVKNSFDANATRVDLYFGTDKIAVADNGNGMSYDDIEKKWLFVAYSSKRPENRASDYREEVGGRKHLAGSKGIGRFSTDRLGKIVRLQTRPKTHDSGPVHSVVVDWGKFDSDHLQRFEEIGVDYSANNDGFDLPTGIPPITHGTIITIEKTRQSWDREKILDLKSALSKLINPFGEAVDGFEIRVYSPTQLAADRAAERDAASAGEDLSPNDVVNGAVGNFIFSTLQEKTTFIDVRILEGGEQIESKLVDRGELIYRIQEPNTYNSLKNSGFTCQLFFLNQSAKATFTRRMGIRSHNFGSVFLFRNGFRVYPVGEKDNDWYGMDSRKAQGYARFLGTRDVIGRVDVSGEGGQFEEASSRNTGLIENLAVVQLRHCFLEHCLKRLERYVVPVTYGDKEDKNTDDISRLLTDPGRARVTTALAKLVDKDDVQLLEYSKRLVGIIDERSEDFSGSLKSLRAIAEKTKDTSLAVSIAEAEERFSELRKSEESAQRQADEERRAREAAEARAVQAETTADKLGTELSEEKKRNHFLSSISALDKDTILNLHHQVTIYAVDINQQIENFLYKWAGKQTVPREDLVNSLERISLLNRKVMGISRFATKANFRLESEKIEIDLAEYVEQYINDVAREFLIGPMTISVTNDGKGFVQRFKPIDVAVVIDNLISNARKARAGTVSFEITHPSNSTIHIRVADDGKGFDKRIAELDRIFEKGFTLTDGSGLGLYHVRHVLGEMKGTIEANKGPDGHGTNFLIRLAK